MPSLREQLRITGRNIFLKKSLQNPRWSTPSSTLCPTRRKSTAPSKECLLARCVSYDRNDSNGNNDFLHCYIDKLPNKDAMLSFRWTLLVRLSCGCATAKRSIRQFTALFWIWILDPCQFIHFSDDPRYIVDKDPVGRCTITIKVFK